MSSRKKIAVIGIGHFGGRLCRELAEADVEVLSIDKEERQLESLREVVSQSIILDSTDEESLKGIGISEYDHVVVAIGQSIECSLLTVAHLQNLGVKSIVARASHKAHEVILKQMKVSRIFLPEADAARQMARSLSLEGAGASINLSKDYIILEVAPPEWAISKSVESLHLISEYRISLITMLTDVSEDELLSIGKQKEVTISGLVSPKDIVKKDCRLLLFGKEKDIQLFLNDE